MPMDHQRLEAVAGNAAASARRRAICRRTADVLGTVGLELWVGGYLLGADRASGSSPFGFGDDAVVGLATVSQTAAELVSGAADLLDRDNLYAAAALLRQLVEAEYLAWAFAEDRAEAAAWLRSTSEARREMWQPRHLRRRSGGRFRATDYEHHCECGGHPTPSARRLLRGHSSRDHVEYWWFDLALHSSSVWRYVHCALSDFGWSQVVDTGDLGELVDAWWQADPLRPYLVGRDPS